jgi:hypothetical protein
MRLIPARNVATVIAIFTAVLNWLISLTFDVATVAISRGYGE